MSDEEILEKVKTALGIGGTFQDATLLLYIDEVKEFLKSAGIKATTLAEKKCIGIITRGVSDLWNYGAGNAMLSEYFKQRAIQLALEEKVSE